MKNVRTRFAPSPTGFQHVGGFRTAVYAWLLAKKHNGQFILRVEDTDQERLVPGATKYLVDSLHWLGIDYDEGPNKQVLAELGESTDNAPEQAGEFGPYIQSKRLELYQEAAERLVAEGKAYRCDCTPERLEQERNEQMARRERPGYSGYCRTRNVSKDTKHVIRFRLPDQINLTLDDAVRGKIVWENPPLRDPVLLKSDGFPTYHLACVVDDNAMEISHVLRGEEWIPTTPIHLLLYDAFGWERPIFAHLSHILGSDGKKLSKRHGAKALNEYAEAGVIPEALVNYITLIGWSPGAGNEQEVFSIDELIQAFSLEGLNASGGVFDDAKLEWMNGTYLRSLSKEKFTELVKDQITKCTPEAWDILADHVKERIKFTDEVTPYIDFLWQDKLEREMPAIFNKQMDAELAKKVYAASEKKLGELDEFSTEKIKEALESVITEENLNMGQVLLPVRIAVTGKKSTPPLFESIEALGKEKTLARLAEMPALIDSYVD